MKRLLLIALIALAACKEEVAKIPDPVRLTEESLSHFCQMSIAEHDGPKGQIHLEGYPFPLFFAQVRDTVAYLKSPERDAAVTAVYVSDMSKAASWADLGADNWIQADVAYYVVGAKVAGGMGAQEIVPFGDQASASIFVRRFGGSVLPFDQIPAEAAIGPIDLDAVLETPS